MTAPYVNLIAVFNPDIIESSQLDLAQLMLS